MLDHMLFNKEKWYQGNSRSYIGDYASATEKIYNYLAESGGFGPQDSNPDTTFGKSKINGQFTAKDGTIMLHVAWIGRGHDGTDPYGDWFKLSDLNITSN